jgi:hypothetical protein
MGVHEMCGFVFMKPVVAGGGEAELLACHPRKTNRRPSAGGLHL